MSARRRFYELRDRRTREYGVTGDYHSRPVRLVAGEEIADSPRGQQLLLNLVNMLARFHRTLVLEVPRAKLIMPDAVIGVTASEHLHLDEAARAMATTIDPFIELPMRSSECDMPSIGLGSQGARKAAWYISSDDGLVSLAKRPMGLDCGDGFSLGACLGACIASAVLLKLVLRKPVASCQLSAWCLHHGNLAQPGPRHLDPLDVGRVLMVGAGGVGSCLAYWLRQCHVFGDWAVVDGDSGELHNTNRCLGLLPSDTDWNEGRSISKAATAADLFGASFRSCWYGDLRQEDLVSDLILPLANDRGIREAVSWRGDPILLHATTSRTWEAQLHRHLPDRDDCITCRMPPRSSAVELCSTVRLGSGESSSDAALSFLSATAGVLLLSGLYRLMEGDLSKEQSNWWRASFAGQRVSLRRGRRKCSVDCLGGPSASVRRRAAAGGRWASLDQGQYLSDEMTREPHDSESIRCHG